MKTFLFKLLFALISIHCAAQVIELPEKMHGSVKITYDLPTKYNEQVVEFSWVDSNPQAFKAVKVEWYPEDWYIRTRTPLFDVKNPAKPFCWTYKLYKTYNALAVATFADGTKVLYPFLVSLQRPQPVIACAPERCPEIEHSEQ